MESLVSVPELELPLSAEVTTLTVIEEQGGGTYLVIQPDENVSQESEDQPDPADWSQTEVIGGENDTMSLLKQDPEPVAFPHASILLSSADWPLSECKDRDCGCHLVHCPLCQPGLKGVNYRKVMLKHFESHVKKAAKFGEWLVLRCRLGCATTGPVPHYHCPQCGLTLLSSNLPAQKLLDSHLSMCDHGNHEGEVLSLMKAKGGGSDFVPRKIHHEVVDSTQTPASEVPFPHPSIQPADAKFDVERCHGNSCNCGKFHCVLCPVEKPPMKHRSKALIHAKLHTNHYVELEGLRLLLCALPCTGYYESRPLVDTEIRTHYHCPTCGRTLRRKIDMQSHVQGSCKGPRTGPSGRVEQAVDLGEASAGTGNIAVKQEFGENGVEAADGSPSLETQQETIMEDTGLPESDRRMSTAKQDNEDLHPSILTANQSMAIRPCKRNSCGCNDYHCPLCPEEKGRLKYRSAFKLHMMKHFRSHILYKGMKVLVCCRTDCGVGRQSGLVTKRHYHCPECVTVWSSHTLWRKHLSLDHGIQTEDELVSGEQSIELKDETKQPSSETKQCMVTRGNQLRYRHGDAQEAIGLDVVMGTGRRGKRKFRPAQVDCKREERTLDEEVKKSQYGHPAASPSVFEELGIRRCRVVLERLQESIFEPASKDQITSSSTTSGPTAMSDIPNSTGTLVSSVVMDTRPESESEILSVEDPGEVLDTGILSPQAALSGQMEDGEVTTDPEFPPPTSTDSTPDASLEIFDHLCGSLRPDVLRSLVPGSEEVVLRQIQQETGAEWRAEPGRGYLLEGAWPQLVAARGRLQALLREGRDNEQREKEICVPLDDPTTEPDPANESSETHDQGDGTDTGVRGDDVVKDRSPDDEDPEPKWPVSGLDIPKTGIKEILKQIPDGQHTCPVCEKTSKSTQLLLRHICHNECRYFVGNLSYPVEDWALSNLAGLVKHAVQVVSGLACPLCAKKFPDNGRAVYHYLVRSCQRKRMDRATLRQKAEEYGIRQDMVTRLFVCPYQPECRVKKLGLQIVVEHVEAVHLPRIHECPHCDRKLSTPKLLKRHMNNVHVNPGQRRVVCHLCGMSTVRENIHRHIAVKHQARHKVYQCNQCRFRTHRHDNLLTHFRNNHRHLPCICDICGKGFSLASRLSRHKDWVHHGLRAYSPQELANRKLTHCGMCSAVMMQKNLKRHMKVIHSGTREFDCPNCEKRFSTRASSLQHQLVHKVDTNNKRVYRYSCNTCGQGFNKLYYYREHTANAHSGVRPYQCGQCRQTFRFRFVLEKHMEVHEDSSLVCDYCTRIFQKTKQLKVHMRVRHRVSGVKCGCGIMLASQESYRQHRGRCTGKRSDWMTKPVQEGDHQVIYLRPTSQLQLLYDGDAVSDQVLPSGEEIEHYESSQTEAPAFSEDHVTVKDQSGLGDQLVVIDPGKGELLATAGAATETSEVGHLTIAEDGTVYEVPLYNMDSDPTATEVIQLGNAEQTVVIATDIAGLSSDNMVIKHGQEAQEAPSLILLQDHESREEGAEHQGVHVADILNTMGVLEGEEQGAGQGAEKLEQGGEAEGTNYACGYCQEMFYNEEEAARHVVQVHQ